MINRFAIYPDPDTSEVSDEADKLSDLLSKPSTHAAEIRRNGELYASAAARGAWSLSYYGVLHQAGLRP